jgi:hypothetical protein
MVVGAALLDRRPPHFCSGVHSIKSLMRSRGIQVAGTAVYTTAGRSTYTDRLSAEARNVANLLYRQHDQLADLRKQVQKEMISEAANTPSIAA